jgi:hypothetical protein
MRVGLHNVAVMPRINHVCKMNVYHSNLFVNPQVTINDSYILWVLMKVMTVTDVAHRIHILGVSVLFYLASLTTLTQ